MNGQFSWALKNIFLISEETIFEFIHV